MHLKRPLGMIDNPFLKMRGGKSCPPRAPGLEIFFSWLGSFTGIAAIYVLGHWQGLHLENQLFLIGSFGASAVLLYAIPMSPFAQPRNLVLGHILSALIGVTCARYLPLEHVLTAATAVSLSIVVMHYTRSLHPPGGATALIAVAGGTDIQQLGYHYVLVPVALGAFLMLIVALLINNLSPLRRYPQYWW